MGAALVGYRLIETKTGAVVQEWGGSWGSAPPIPNPLLLPNGDQVCSASLDVDYNGYVLTEWLMERPAKVLFDGADFLNRVTDAEYEAITGSQNVQVRRWLDTFRLRGEVDVTGATALAAKQGLVALKLLTPERAAVIFAPE